MSIYLGLYYELTPQLYYFQRNWLKYGIIQRQPSHFILLWPSLSGSIASLEKELGVSLFQKKGRNIRLTKYGEEFYRYVSESFGILEPGISL